MMEREPNRRTCTSKLRAPAATRDARICADCLQSIKRASHFPPHFSTQLSLQQHLSGHRGCVNRLAWNEDGSLLASGSDDRQVRRLSS